jgi:hypothetical protein
MDKPIQRAFLCSSLFGYQVNNSKTRLPEAKLGSPAETAKPRGERTRAAKVTGRWLTRRLEAQIIGDPGYQRIECCITGEAEDVIDVVVLVRPVHRLDAAGRRRATHGRAKWWRGSNVRCSLTLEEPLQPACARRSTSATSSPRSRARRSICMRTSTASADRWIASVVAQGAAEISRHGVGTPVFAGMIAASAVGIFVIPMLYVVFQDFRERALTAAAAIAIADQSLGVKMSQTRPNSGMPRSQAGHARGMAI